MKLASGGGEGGGRGDSEEGGLVGGGDLELDVLAGEAVGGGEGGGVGHVDGNVVEGLRCWADVGDWAGCEECRVLADCGGDGGEDAAPERHGTLGMRVAEEWWVWVWEGAEGNGGGHSAVLGLLLGRFYISLGVLRVLVD
ncbi:hypothetical protein vseg_016041 [Gypsophila vaccaria]